MAAHIIRDLPHALTQVGLEDVDGRSHIRDFHAINKIMGDTVDDMQSRIGERYAHYLRWLDGVGRAQDELRPASAIPPRRRTPRPPSRRAPPTSSTRPCASRS